MAPCSLGGRLMYGLKPIYDFVDMDYTKQVKLIKDSMYVIYNRARGMLLVMDVDDHNTHYQIMRVQNPDGTPRPFDERVLTDLRRLHQRGPDSRKILAELEEMEHMRQLRVDVEADDLTYGMKHDFKWAGVDVTPSTLMRDRSLLHVQRRRVKLEQNNTMRELIRASAQ